MKEAPTKVCTSCGIEKSITDFSKNQYGKDNRILRRPVCNKEKVRNFKADIVLDHSHIYGSIRGWICGSCNTSIGKFGENINTLERAIKWIKGTLKILFSF